MPTKSRSSKRPQESPRQAAWRDFASGIKRLVARDSPSDKLVYSGILALESGLPFEEWYTLRTGGRPIRKGKWARLPDREEWNRLCHYFGIASEKDLEQVLDLADLDKRSNEAVRDRSRDRLDLQMRKLARRESQKGVTIYHDKLEDKSVKQEPRYLPPYRANSLKPLVELVNLDPMRLSRWYVAQLLFGLHILGWNASEAERRRARDLGNRLGRAITQPLGKGKPRTFSLVEFRYTAALYERMKGDAFTYAKELPREEAFKTLHRAYPRAPGIELAFLVDTCRSSTLKNPDRLLVVALRKRFGVMSDRHVYRLLKSLH